MNQKAWRIFAMLHACGIFLVPMLNVFRIPTATALVPVSLVLLFPGIFFSFVIVENFPKSMMPTSGTFFWFIAGSLAALINSLVWVWLARAIRRIMAPKPVTSSASPSNMNWKKILFLDVVLIALWLVVAYGSAQGDPSFPHLALKRFDGTIDHVNIWSQSAVIASVFSIVIFAIAAAYTAAKNLWTGQRAKKR